jgi:FG-GAP-like repeat
MTKGSSLLYNKFFWAFLYGLVILVSATNATAGLATFTAKNYPFLGNNHITADFNADGKLDLAGTGANSAAIMLNNGDGTFKAKAQFPVGGQAQDLASGDFNGDGKLDLVVTINTQQIGFSLLTGNGNGTFNAPVNFPNTSGFDSPAVVASDFNNDGKLDVAIAHQIGCYTAPCIVARTISVMLGNGNGTFQSLQDMDVGTGMSKIAVGDFNKDGKKDLAISGDRAQVFILNGIGNGTFVKQPTITLIAGDPTGVDGTDIDVADFNKDLFQDLVVAIGLNGSRTAILIGNGNGTFKAPSIITDKTLSVPQYQAVADFNLDGFEDLAIAFGNGTGGLIEILNGNGNGTFQAPVYYLVPPPNSSIGGGKLIAADFKKDSKPDIALQVVGAAPALTLLINSTGSTPKDSVAIARAEYEVSKKILRVEATSSRSDATLKVYVTSTGQLIGTLTNDGGGRYKGDLSWPSNPQNITVRSSFGGEATRGVTQK